MGLIGLATRVGICVIDCNWRYSIRWFYGQALVYGEARSGEVGDPLIQIQAVVI